MGKFPNGQLGQSSNLQWGKWKLGSLSTPILGLKPFLWVSLLKACHDASGRVATVPVPSALKPEITKKDVAPISQHTICEVNADSKAKKDALTTSASSVSQAQKPPVLPMGAISMLMSYPQPPASFQFGGPNPQLQSQGLPSASLPMPMQMPLPMGNPSQVHQQVYLPHHLMHAQGIMHQSQGLGFNPQMGQLPPQLGGLGLHKEASALH